MSEKSTLTIDPLIRFPGYLLQRASIAAGDTLGRELAAVSLRRVEASLLQVIQANPGLKQSDACRMLAVQRANMAPLVASLERRGLIKRKPIDGRSQAISLTRKGQSLARRALDIIDGFERNLVDAVPSHLQAYVAPILMAIWSGCSSDDEAAATNRAS